MFTWKWAFVVSLHASRCQQTLQVCWQEKMFWLLPLRAPSAAFSHHPTTKYRCNHAPFVAATRNQRTNHWLAGGVIFPNMCQPLSTILFGMISNAYCSHTASVNPPLFDELPPAQFHGKCLPFSQQQAICVDRPRHCWTSSHHPSWTQQKDSNNLEDGDGDNLDDLNINQSWTCLPKGEPYLYTFCRCLITNYWSNKQMGSEKSHVSHWTCHFDAITS